MMVTSTTAGQSRPKAVARSLERLELLLALRGRRHGRLVGIIPACAIHCAAARSQWPLVILLSKLLEVSIDAPGHRGTQTCKYRCCYNVEGEHVVKERLLESKQVSLALYGNKQDHDGTKQSAHRSSNAIPYDLHDLHFLHCHVPQDTKDQVTDGPPDV